MVAASSSLGHVNARVFEEHVEIRARLQGLGAYAAASSSPMTGVVLRVSLLRFTRFFDAHLQFEEREVAPRIRELDAWGPVRESRMLDEHVEQRMRLARICGMAEDPSTDTSELAFEIMLFVATLLGEMEGEEHALAELEHVETYGVIQMTG